MLSVRAYPRETQEMVFDAHDRAFALFKGACGRGIYDNMKTAVETIFVGKGRLYNRRFLQMCSHYLVDPVACTPASAAAPLLRHPLGGNARRHRLEDEHQATGARGPHRRRALFACAIFSTRLIACRIVPSVRLGITISRPLRWGRFGSGNGGGTCLVAHDAGA